MNSLFPVPFQQSSYLEWPWVCSCHLPQAAWLMKESFVLLISDTLCAAQVPRTKSVEHTMNLSPASFKRNKRKTSFTWDVFLSVKLLLPILKKNIILSIFKSFSIVCSSLTPLLILGQKQQEQKVFFCLFTKILKLGKMLAFWRESPSKGILR